MYRSMSTHSAKQAAHWSDVVAAAIKDWMAKAKPAKLHVDDMKTPSGRVHTGALRGVLLHDIVAKSVTGLLGEPVTSTYVFNDMDPMDGLPSYLDQAVYQEHMGKSLFQIPAPPLEKSGIDVSLLSESEKTQLQQARSFAEFYAFDFISAFRRLGCDQEIVWSHELYQSGKMDAVIRKALDSVETLRKIYQEVADYKLPEKWYPFQVICPECGKVGTTLVTDWDGKTVAYECQPNKVTWAKGCGHTGRISPFGGTGKLLWKVDWPAHWTTLGVTIEGAGKDHTSAGGSRDMANHIIREVFDHTIPFDIPYEWILIRGAKMSSSKGVGTAAREFIELFPQAIGRFLFVDRVYNQVIDFDPFSMAIPDLFDEYDRAAQQYWGQIEGGDERLTRSFALAHQGKTPQPHFVPRFRDLAIWIQSPDIDVVSKANEVKGSALTPFELTQLQERAVYARRWVTLYAPAEFQLSPTKEVPEAARTLTADQKAFLTKVETLVSEKTWDPTELQTAIYTEAKNTLGARQGFEAIYLAFLGKKSGPRAAWLLLSMELDYRSTRIKTVSEL